MVLEVLRSLKASEAELVCDVTFGDGGYAAALFETMPATGRVVGIDRDPVALMRARERLSSYSDRIFLVEGNFRRVGELAAGIGITQFDGIVADLGLSRRMLAAEAGFSYALHGPLSMKMGPDCKIDASQVINDFSEQRLASIIKEYGEERRYRSIARTIVRYRKRKRIDTTDELAAIIRKAVGEQHIIKTLARVFQGIRIFVNDELKNLTLFLPQAVDLLKAQGRLVIISYNSLEDKITKNFFREMADPCICPVDSPRCVCGRKPQLEIIGKLVVPSAQEINANPQSRSARMRTCQKLNPGQDQ
jgi:16S rRNA (cytosine1402-N4)-methyltransferase